MVNPQAKEAMHIKVQDQNNVDPFLLYHLYLKGLLLIRHSMWRC
jgi:hypothetical protein